MVRNFRCKIHLLLLLIFFVIVIKKVNAHHLRAGDITIELISCQSYTYLLTITGYTDNRIKLEFGYEVLDFGDGTFIDLDTCKPYSMVDLGEFVTQKIFRIKHTFPGPGNYTIRYHEPNRNDNVLNMYNSGYVAFYVETQVIIDPFLFCNNTPILLNPPIDKGVVGQIYEHNPAAWDPDGDSLAYKLVPCKQNRDMNVPGYTLPSLHDIQEVGAKNYLGTGPATISMDSLSGDLIWDSPAIKGQYNVAFIVEEWRMINGEWYKLGYVTRDMQILIDDSENHPPRLYLPQDTCVEVGTKLEVEIFAEDPDGHDVTIETFSGIFNLFGSAVRLDPDSVFPQSSPARVQLIWETHCNHVRKKPYQIIFKATDHPTELNEQPPLVDFGSWFVTIVAPAPTGLTATVSPDNEVVLNWDPYVCTSAETMQIWRRIGDYEFEYGHCQTGIPESAGYEMIGEVPISDTTFIDSGEQTELSYNAKYCYRLVATFPPPRNGESYPSEKACIIIGMNNVPVITHVDVEKTGEYDGEIIVRWIPPITMDEEVYELPYIYRLFRSESISTDHNPDEIAELNFENTIYLDHDINTLNKTYYYQVKLFDAKDSLMGSSPFASSVKLSGTPVLNGVELTWKAEVPWSLNTKNYPWHYIYRDQSSSDDLTELTLIDSVNVNTRGFRYVDTGQSSRQVLDEKKIYHYYVKSMGSYGNSDIPEPLMNRSQIIGIYPNDTIAPCIPIELHFGNITSIYDCWEFVEDKPCDFKEYFNEIYWERDLSGNCDPDNSSFNIYFSNVSVDGPYEIIANVTDTFFIHNHLESFAGCYRVSSLDNAGNESEPSDPICHDNCPYYELPNVFTPNGDGKNDTFQAFDKPTAKCPRFVHDVHFRVYNRDGFEVYNSDRKKEANIYINWNGRDFTGKMLPAGTYFYIAEVNFISIDPQLAKHVYKGWVQLLR